MNVDIEKLKMTDDVIRQIIDIDKEFYLDFDYSNPEWYYTRYSEKNEITVLKVEDKIAGYYLFIKISRKLFDDIIKLKYSGDYDFPERDVNVESDIEYIPSVLVKSEYKKYSSRLLLELIKEFKTKQTVVAIAISDEGKRMCGKFMTKLGSPKENIEVYMYKRSQNERQGDI